MRIDNSRLPGEISTLLEGSLNNTIIPNDRQKNIGKAGAFKPFPKNCVHPDPANKATEGALDAVLSL